MIARFDQNWIGRSYVVTRNSVIVDDGEFVVSFLATSSIRETSLLRRNVLEFY